MNAKHLAAATLASVAALGIGIAVAQQAPAPSPDRAPRQAWLFDQIDTNKDGKVTQEEVQAFLTIRFAAIDTDKDGAISLAEAEAARGGEGRHRRASVPQQSERIAARFRALDANADGRVTLVEVQPVAAAFFRALDANADGVVTREEAAAMRGRGRGGPRTF